MNFEEDAKIEPTNEMKQNAPDLVATEVALYQTHKDHLKAINPRITLAEKELDLLVTIPPIT